MDVLESALKSGNPPSTETIEAAMDEAWIPKLSSRQLSREDYVRMRIQMGMTPEEMDTYINLTPWTYMQWEVLWADRITFINSPALGEAIVEALPEWVDIPLHEAIDKVVAVLGKPKK